MGFDPFYFRHVCLTYSFGIKVFDPDLDDTARFSLGEFSYSDDSLSQVTNPFKLQDSTNNVVLNFEVQSNMKGHFTVNVSVEDAGTVRPDYSPGSVYYTMCCA